ncbi:methyltransferase domain-containing protein [Patescibacteria group bacterium]|nr:methyltransferase domain-containing protein [Patescibacteria group bacterium]
MIPFDFFNKNFICPDCLSRFKKEISLKLSKQDYYCSNCQKKYPIKKIVYILKNKCNPKKCKFECIKSCKKTAIKKTIIEEKGHFMLNGIIKNIKNPGIIIKDKCNNCRKCIKTCPFNALIAINIPTFLVNEYSKNEDTTRDSKKNNSEIFNLQLRTPIKENEIRPASFLLYKIISRKIKSKEENKITIDNGSGSNLAKSFIQNENILSFDIHTDHNAFYPLDLLVNSEHLPIKKECVNSFISVNVVEHVTNPLKYLLEMNRTLKNNGELIIAVPTPWWHLSKLLSLHHHLNYMIHIIKGPFNFLKNPFKNFNIFWSHEKDCNHENTKETSTLISEIKKFNIIKWEKLFNDSGFIIKERTGAGNIFSNNIFAGKITRKLGNSKKCPIFLVYVLKKRI